MSFVIATSELVTAAATDLANIGSTLNAAKSAAATSTTGVLAAAEDEVSAAIAAAFSAHGQGFAALGAQAAAFHDQFVQALAAGAGSYVSAEAVNVAAFTANPAQTIGQDLLDVVNVPFLALKLAKSATSLLRRSKQWSVQVNALRVGSCRPASPSAKAGGCASNVFETPTTPAWCPNTLGAPRRASGGRSHAEHRGAAPALLGGTARSSSPDR